MSGLQTPMSLAAQAAADAQAAAQAAAATQAAAAAQAAAQAPAPATISATDFMQFLQAYKAPTKLTTIDQPRAGGVNTTGAWTGSGSGQLGTEPFSGYCMRSFQADPIKNHQAMAPIEERCRRGLSSATTDPLFSMAGEPDADKTVLSIKAFEKLVMYCGMDSVFYIVLDDGSKVNMLKEPGLVTKTMVDTWCEDVLSKGVHRNPTLGIRYPPCPFDKTNMSWSGDALLNSCTVALRTDLETRVAIQDRTGPNLLCEILLSLYRPSHSKIRSLRAQLEALSIRDFPGENVTQFVLKATSILTEITMNCMQHDQVPDIVAVALTGLLHSSDPYFRGKVRDVRSKSDRDNHLTRSTAAPAPASKLHDVTQILTDFDELYRTLVQQNDYAPAAQPVLPKGVQGLVGEVKELKEQLGKLQQDRNSKSSGGSKPAGSSGVCRICGGEDHWANTCPNKGATPSGSAPTGGTRAAAKHGLDDATNLQVIALIKEKEKTLPTRFAIATLYEADSKVTEQYDISLNGKVIAKYCLHCGRYTKGKTAHSSAEHTGRLFNPRPGGAAPSPAPAPGAAATIASFPIGAPEPPVSAAVAASIQGLDLSSVPVVDTDQFLCQPANYDTPVMFLNSILDDTGDIFDSLQLKDGGR